MSEAVKKKAGVWLIATGLTGSTFSLLVDFIGLGKAGIQAFQLVTLLAGIFLAAFGWGLFQEGKGQNTKPSSEAKARVLSIANWPVIIWLSSGLVLVYLGLFVSRVFFNSNLRFHYFITYLPDKYPIGLDIALPIEYILRWFNTGQSPYINGIYSYPPLFNIIFAGFSLIDYPWSYYLLVLLTLLVFFASVLLFFILSPKNGTDTIDFSGVVFFLGTGLFSYGLLFELERGQGNLLSISFALIGIILFHFRPSFRLLGYMLFSVAVHIKIFPVFLVLMFVRDWRLWRENLFRLLGLGLFNLVLLFSMGAQEVINFILDISKRFNTLFTWVGNHSIYGFIANLTNHGLGILHVETAQQLRPYALFLRTFLLACVLICLFLIIFRAYKENQTGFNKYLLVACTIAAMLIPSESQDYKLSMLPPVLAILFSEKMLLQKLQHPFAGGLAVLFASIAYSVMLFPFKYRPDFWANSAPLLFILLTCVTFLALLIEKREKVAPA